MAATPDRQPTLEERVIDLEQKVGDAVGAAVKDVPAIGADVAGLVQGHEDRLAKLESDVADLAGRVHQDVSGIAHDLSPSPAFPAGGNVSG